VTSAFSAADVEAFELAAARAWPPARIERIAGWRVRLSGGGSRRANSVLPIGYDGSDADGAIDRIEVLYRAQKTRSYFQVSSASAPTDLDARLAARGYTFEEPCFLMAKRLGVTSMPSDVTVTETPMEAWLAIYTEPLDPIRKAAAPATLASVPAPHAFFTVTRGGEATASALGVLDPATGTVVVECVATRTDQRRTGAARIVMDGLEAWAAGQGASFAILQVVDNNYPAITLYERRGYTIAGRYHYRYKCV
jgi:GNAT superfamily N-acetyltransferase